MGAHDLFDLFPVIVGSGDKRGGGLSRFVEFVFFERRSDLRAKRYLDRGFSDLLPLGIFDLHFRVYKEYRLLCGKREFIRDARPVGYEQIRRIDRSVSRKIKFERELVLGKIFVFINESIQLLAVSFRVFGVRTDGDVRAFSRELFYQLVDAAVKQVVLLP